MKNLKELTISIPIGSGCTGNAFQNKEPTIAVLEQSWGKYVLNEIEMKKVHHDLLWIFSMPVVDPDGSGKLLGVINIDCLSIRKTKDEIEKFSSDMICWSGVIAPLLKKYMERI